MAKRLTTAQLSTEIEDLRARLETSQRMCEELRAEIAGLRSQQTRVNPAKRGWEPSAERKALIALFHAKRAEGKQCVIKGNELVVY